MNALAAQAMTQALDQPLPAVEAVGASAELRASVSAVPRQYLDQIGRAHV